VATGTSIRRRLRPIFGFLTVLLVLFVVWESVKLIGGDRWRYESFLGTGIAIDYDPPLTFPFATDSKLPHVWDIAAEFGRSDAVGATTTARLARAGLFTLRNAAIGFTLGSIFGLLLAIVLVHVRILERALVPLIVASQTIPIIAIAPLLVIWFGYDLAPKITVVALICFFPIVVSTIDGLSGVDPDYANLVRAMGGSERDVFWRVRLPGALPAIFSGAKIAVTYSVIGAIVGEWVGASRGIGIYMVRAADQMLTERVFAAIVLSSLLSIALFLIVAGVERAALPWHHARPRRSGHRR
jgi:ABC-type nitrate/sulfonate/bicarbonate transport system permease component